MSIFGYDREDGQRMSKRRMLFTCGVMVLAAAVIGVGAYIGGRYLEEKDVQPQRGQMSEDFLLRDPITYAGKKYQRKPGQTTILLMGVDRTSDTPQKGFRSGGQADFLLLAVLDSREKTISRLHIDRDTMTEVHTVGILGGATGSRRMQICLSHGFGADAAQCCENTRTAVEKLLLQTDIDLYMEVELNGIAAINDALGGVEVTLTEDLTAFDPQMEAGRTMTLQGKQAEYFVRYRFGVGDETNASRMKRQQAYMSAAAERFKENARTDEAYIGRFYDQLADVSHTDISRGRMINEINKAFGYEVPPVSELAGKHQIGEDGFVEFIPDESALASWVLNTLYVAQE